MLCILNLSQQTRNGVYATFTVAQTPFFHQKHNITTQTMPNGVPVKQMISSDPEKHEIKRNAGS